MHDATMAQNQPRYVPHICCIGGTSTVQKFAGPAEIPPLHCYNCCDSRNSAVILGAITAAVESPALAATTQVKP